jgi:two-component system sensor histidine kinase CpxA
MRSLFLKIFLSYWMAQALFLVLAILVTLATRPSREISNLQAQEPKFLNEALQAYQSGGDEGARKYLRNVHDNQHVRLFIFDDQGRELLGRNPTDFERVKRGRVHTADTFLGRFGPGQFLRQSITADNGRRYLLIIELVQLRGATQKLASGDLTARAGMPASRRHDEMAELMRDFDRMAERLEDLVTAQNRLLTDISHELRSPLARLNVALELARQRSGPEARSALDRIDRETNRLNQLIQRLLTIARLEAGDESIEKIPVHLEQIINEIAKDAAFEAQGRGCQVEATIVDDCVVVGSPSLLHSAIENVVRNAIRYTYDGTSVEVRLEQGVGQQNGASVPEAVVRVTDSGPGVPEDALDKLFRPFYRIDDARGRQTGGVGLGLAITDRAVRLHGGTIRVSNRPQGGLMVEIRLPLASEETRDTTDPQTITILSREL